MTELDEELMLCFDDEVQLEDELVENSLLESDELLDERESSESELKEVLDRTKRQLKLWLLGLELRLLLLRLIELDEQLMLSFDDDIQLEDGLIDSWLDESDEQLDETERTDRELEEKLEGAEL